MSTKFVAAFNGEAIVLDPLVIQLTFEQYAKAIWLQNILVYHSMSMMFWPILFVVRYSLKYIKILIHRTQDVLQG
jgi:hypothetical protein